MKPWGRQFRLKPRYTLKSNNKVPDLLLVSALELRAEVAAVRPPQVHVQGAKLVNFE